MTAMTKPADTRQRIIEAVLWIIGQDGISAVTNRRIAKEAGVSLGSVTYHFASQHELLRESLLQFVAEETRRFTELADQCDGDGTRRRAGLRRRRPGRRGHGVRQPAHRPVRALHPGGPRRPAAARRRECFAAYDRLAQQILTGLGVPDAERVAGTVVAVVFGQQLRRLATGAPAEHLVDALMMLTRGGL